MWRNFPVRTPRAIRSMRARENLKEAVELVLESNRALAREDAGNDDLIREPLRLATG
jgi:hypothetical protein